MSSNRAGTTDLRLGANASWATIGAFAFSSYVGTIYKKSENNETEIIMRKSYVEVTVII